LFEFLKRHSLTTIHQLSLSISIKYVVSTSRDNPTGKDPKSQWSVTVELAHKIEKYLFSFIL
jgi:hypothetical protein